MCVYRTQFLKCHVCGCVQDPVRVPLGETYVWKGKGSKRRCVVNKDHAMYVPVLKTLQTLMKNEAIYAEVKLLH